MPKNQTSEDTIAALCDEYKDFNKEHGLNLGSADEHLFDETLTSEQRQWVADFVRRWDEASGK